MRFVKIALDLSLIKVNDIAKIFPLMEQPSMWFRKSRLTYQNRKNKKEIIKSSAVEGFSNYPANRLCFETWNYHGRINWPGRANHHCRVELGGESWGYHYSPYAYYSEHAIFLSWKPRTNEVDEGAFADSAEIVTQFRIICRVKQDFNLGGSVFKS